MIYHSGMNNMSGIYQIAIDGTTASGKGTVAKMLARKFGYLCLDTGAIYRGITVYFLDHEIDPVDPVAIHRAVGDVELDVRCVEGNTLIFLHGVDITKRIRDNIVSTTVPNIARIPEVRAKVREIQTRAGEQSTLVCEGRDITSVVFPNARFKFYVDCSVEERAKRRLNDLIAKGEEVSITVLEEQIAARDRADMSRTISPLVCVKDAVRLDSTKMSAFEVVRRMERIITKSLIGSVKEKHTNV